MAVAHDLQSVFMLGLISAMSNVSVDALKSAAYEQGAPPRVSVIIPVYNVEPYIGKSIESLRAQTMDELEFIFVEDCSTDGSMAAVEAWAAEDPRVRVIRNEENLGAGPSRNRGIEAARGDYLSFVDPDDYVAPDFYQLLYAAATSDGGHDIAKGIRETVNQDGARSRAVSQRLNKQILDALRKGKPLFTVFRIEHTTALYRRTLIDAGARNGTARKDEDTTFLLGACLQTEDIAFEPAAVYYYESRADSAVNTEHIGKYLAELDALEEKASLLEGMLDSEPARDYLKVKAKVLLAKYFKGAMADPSLKDGLDEYARRFAEVVGAKHLQFIYDEAPETRALVEQRVLLPCIDMLPPGERLEGALHWIDFVKEHPASPGAYADECAKAIASTIRQAIAKGDRKGLKDSYSQLKDRMEGVPRRRQVRIWLNVYRRITTKRNLRIIGKKH